MDHRLMRSREPVKLEVIGIIRNPVALNYPPSNKL